MATANNNLTTNFNVDPYYDDYDETKNFHRVLYRPGFAVQARELTQQQTILQNQIHRFGNHIFKDGSEVTGTSEVLDQVTVFRLKSTYAGSAIDVSSFEDKYARTRTSEKVFKVKKVQAAAGGEFDLVFAQYIQDANTSAQGSFTTELANNEVIDFSSSFINSNTGLFFSNNGVAQVITTAQGSAAKLPVTLGYLYGIDESVYYHKGLFIRADKQTVAVAANTSHKISIGFTSTETLISSDDDSTLTDPARGSYNYAAPGADRLKVDLTLTTKSITDIAAPPLSSNNYFEVARVSNGTFARKRPDPDYSSLGDVLAQRTYEESGHYVVDGFQLTIANTSASTANLVASFSPGTAYVKGYRINNPGVQAVALPKSRATESATEQTITAYYGNYVVANTFTTGLFGFNDRVELHSNNTPTSATKIGEAHVRNVEYLSGSSDQRKYKLFLYDININAADNKVFNNVKSVIKGTHSSYTAFAAIHSDSITSFNKIGNITSGSTTVDLTSGVAGVKVGQVIENNAFAANTIVSAISFDSITLSNQATVSNTASTITFRSVKLTDKDYNTSLFAMPHINIANTVNVDYKFKRKFAAVSFSSGSATIQTLGGSERFSSGTGDLANENFIVVVKSGGAGTISTGENVDMTAGSRSVTVPTPTPGNPASATIDVDEASFNGTADIYAAIDVTADTRRAKTRQSGTTKTIVGGYPVNGTKLSLGYADGIKLNAVYEGNSTFVSANSMSTITTDKWIFNGGQKDNFYDHATIELKPGYTANSNHLLVDFDYYSHGGGLGYFSDKSYPNYNLIPTYRNSKGEEIHLRDVLDFRPTRSSNTSSNTYSSSKIFDNHQIVDSQTFEVEADYSYYKKVVHKISLDENGNFILTSGASALNYPPVPSTSGDTMLLATIAMNPYTYNETDLKVEVVDNRRYTMRDIGDLETRIENLEYYTSLNLLETQVASTQFLDDNGEARYKNGFIVDDFTGHAVGDVFDTNYKVSIDRQNQILRPRFTSDSTPLVADTGATLVKNNDVVTIPYSEVNYSTQTTATGTMNVNPFQVVVFTGLLKIDPERDIWVDNIAKPTVITNFQGQLDHFEYLKSQVGTDYGRWNINSTGAITRLRGEKYDKKHYGGTLDTISSTYVTTTTRSRIVKKSSLKLTNSIFYEYMRTRKVNFTVEGCRPNSKLYVFFAGENISDHAAPSTYSSTRVEQVLYDANPSEKQIVTDQFGSASGYFWVPNGKQTVTAAAYKADPNARPLPDLSNVNVDDMQVPVGTVDILITDNFINPEVGTTFASATYTAGGEQRTYKLVTKRTRQRGPTTTQKGDFLNTPQSRAEVHRNMAAHEMPASGPFGAVSPFDDTNADHLALADLVYNKYISYINRTPDTAGYKYWIITFMSGADGGVPTLPAHFRDPSSFTPLRNMLNNIEIATNHNRDTGTCAWGYDPLCQTFSVVNEFHPHGIFLSSVDVFMSTKDSNNIPLRIEIRPTVNGFPSADEVIPGTQVSVKPSDITANSSTPTATNIAFPAPVHLEPGEYALVLLSDSLEYNSYICTIGENRLDGTGVVTVQPTLGSLFKSQNARTWTPQQESDLCFNLKQAQFTTGTDYTMTVSANNVARVEYNANTSSANTSGEFDLANIVMPKNDTFVPTTATYQIKTKTKGGSVGSFVGVLPNQDLYFDTTKEISTNSDLQVKVTFRTSDADVSPFFKLDQSGVSLVKNLINPAPTGNFVAETTASDGYAIARYITRKVTLGDGLSAKSLKVFVDQNMPKGSSIEVYYRVINNEDIDNFEDRPYVLMTRRQASTTVNQDVFTYNEYEYYADDISYIKSGISYDEFDAFSIKIVMYADNTAAAPTCRNFRAIALA